MIVWELTANFTPTHHPPPSHTPTPPQVASMQKELEELQPKLVTAREENAKMMVVIERESVEVEARSKIVRKDEEVANEKAAEAKALKEEVRRMGGWEGWRRGGREGTGGWKALKEEVGRREGRGGGGRGCNTSDIYFVV